MEPIRRNHLTLLGSGPTTYDEPQIYYGLAVDRQEFFHEYETLEEAVKVFDSVKKSAPVRMVVLKVTYEVLRYHP